MKETEEIFRLLTNYLEANGLEPTQENFDKFMKDYRAGKIKNEYIDNESRSYQLMEEITDDTPMKDRLKIYQRALEIFPRNYDAYTSLVMFDDKLGLEEKADKLQKKIKEAEQDYRDTGILPANMGYFYKLQGTRPFMRMLSALSYLYMALRKHDEAMSTFEQIIDYNNNDNMGVRHTLSGLYLSKRDFAKFEALWKRYPKSGYDPMALSDKAIARYLQGDIKGYQRYLRLLKDHNVFLYLYFATGNGDWIIDENPQDYALGGIDEAMVYLNEHEELLTDELLRELPLVRGASLYSVFSSIEEPILLTTLSAYVNAVKDNDDSFTAKEVVTEINKHKKKGYKSVTEEELRCSLSFLVQDHYLFYYGDKDVYRLRETGYDMAYLLMQMGNVAMGQ